MTAFEQWWYDQIHIGEGISPQEIWNAALEHAANICEMFNSEPVSHDAVAAEIREEISK